MPPVPLPLSKRDSIVRGGASSQDETLRCKFFCAAFCGDLLPISW